MAVRGISDVDEEMNLLAAVAGKRVEIKIVDQEESYSTSYSSYSYEEEELIASRAAAKFYGPPHLLPLSLECFSTALAQYNYTLCPFHNITQEEIKEDRYSPRFRGVLGIFERWDESSDDFDTMVYSDGRLCHGDYYRNAVVRLVCGEVAGIVMVEETSRCFYSIQFQTPLACSLDDDDPAGSCSLLEHLFSPRPTTTTWRPVVLEAAAAVQLAVVNSDGEEETLDVLNDELQHLRIENRKLKQLLEEHHILYDSI